MTPKPPRKAKPRVTVRCSVRIRAYDLIADALQNVGRVAVRRAYKHREEAPPPDDVIDAINDEVERQVMDALGEVLDFGAVWP